jgi:hypothetical protein
MRYARFRATILGIEPQRRNRTAKEKPNRVTKSKKEPKNPKPKKEGSVKLEPTEGYSSAPEPTEPQKTKVKQENVPLVYGSLIKPVVMAEAVANPASRHIPQPRLPTPCSDIDPYAAVQVMTSSPATELINSPAVFDFPTPHYDHEHTNWQHSPMFPTYDSPYAFDTLGVDCDHHGMHPHGDFGVVPACDGEAGSVNHELWDTYCN